VADVMDDDGVRHRLWILPAGAREGERDEAEPDLAGRLTALASAGAITIADGHHRYETALRYREERRMSRSCEEDPAFDYILALLLDATHEPLTVLPTHRVVLGAGGSEDDGRGLLATAESLFEVRPAARGELLAGFGGEGL